MEAQIDAVLRANDAYRLSSSRAQALASEPSRRLVVLACMDARLDLLPALGLEVGDAHILRNAGGRATPDAFRSLVVSTHLLGTREIAVVHHTRCGLEGMTDAEAASRTGAKGVSFLGFEDLSASVQEDVTAIREYDSLPNDVVVWGAVYDVETGALDVVVPPGRLGERE